MHAPRREVKLALALLLLSGSAIAEPWSPETKGLSWWWRGEVDNLFATDGRVEPPSTTAKLDRIEREVERLAIVCHANEARHAAARRQHPSEHSDAWNRRARPFVGRLAALLPRLWPIGDQLVEVARTLTRDAPSAPRMFRIAAQAEVLFDGLREQDWRIAQERCPRCWIDRGLDLDDFVSGSAAECYELASARLDLDDLERCEAILAVSRPSDDSHLTEIFTRDVLWQPPLVVAR